MDRIFLATNSSEIDSLIEKLRAELSSVVNEDELNGRGLIPPIKYNSDDFDIHNRISNLENSIQKLHKEVLELSKNTANMVKECLTYEFKNKDLNENDSTVILEKYVSVENYENQSIKDSKDELVNENVDKNSSRVFPVTIRNMMMPLTSGSKLDVVNTSDEETNLPDTLKEIKQDVMSLWGDLKEYAQKDNIECLIHELQTEINERLETLKDVDIDNTDA